MSSATLICVQCKDYLFHNPRQCDCGDRLCGRCFQSLKERHKTKFTCLSCGEVNVLENCFRDRAVEYELRNSILKCLNPSCPWEGESKFYQEHHSSCEYGVIPCPNSTYGCTVQLTRSKVDDHLKLDCQFNPVTCQWCEKHTTNEEIHIQRECDQVIEHCPNGCGERLPRREIIKHTRTVCTHQIRDCDYKDMGCQYKGTIKELTKHAKEYTAYHTQLLKVASKEMKQNMEQQVALLDNKTESLRADLSKIKAELSTKLQPLTDAMVKAESAILQLQDGLSEVSLLLQTLQAASYDGTFIWRIPEVTRRRQEAKTYQRGVYTAPVQERDPEASMMMVMSRPCHGTFITRLRQEARMFFSPAAQYTSPVQEHNPDASMTMVVSRRW